MQSDSTTHCYKSCRRVREVFITVVSTMAENFCICLPDGAMKQRLSEKKPFIVTAKGEMVTLHVTKGSENVSLPQKMQVAFA